MAHRIATPDGTEVAALDRLSGEALWKCLVTRPEGACGPPAAVEAIGGEGGFRAFESAGRGAVRDVTDEYVRDAAGFSAAVRAVRAAFPGITLSYRIGGEGLRHGQAAIPAGHEAWRRLHFASIFADEKLCRRLPLHLADCVRFDGAAGALALQLSDDDLLRAAHGELYAAVERAVRQERRVERAKGARQAARSAPLSPEFSDRVHGLVEAARRSLPRLRGEVAQAIEAVAAPLGFALRPHPGDPHRTLLAEGGGPAAATAAGPGGRAAGPTGGPP